MKRPILFLLALLVAGSVHATPPLLGPNLVTTPPGFFTQPGMTVIGRGGTTFAYLDPLGKPCGVALRSYGQYPVYTGIIGTNTPTWGLMGDSPDADPNSTRICTTAQWETYWITTVSPSLTWGAATPTQQNQALVNYLNNDFGFANTGTIYYLSQSGSDSTGTVNDPSHPYATMAKILDVYQTALTSHVSCTGNVSSGSYILTLTGSCSGSPGFQRTDQLTGSHIPAGAAIQGQLPGGTIGGPGQYLMTVNASGNGTAETITGSYLNGGVIVVRAGTWTTCAIDSNGTTCGGTANANWSMSGSYGHPLLLTSFPGELVVDDYVNGGGATFVSGAAKNPGKASCCLILNGMGFTNPGSWGTGIGFEFVDFEDLTIQNTEWAGYVQNFVDPQSANIKITKNVFHEFQTHAIYITFSGTSLTPNYSAGGCSLPAAGDFNFGLDRVKWLNQLSCGAIYQLVIDSNLIYDGGVDGYDLLHLNTWIDQAVVSRNIISYEGGGGIDLQSGNYNEDINNNLVFDIGDAPFELFIDPGPIPPNGPATHRWITIENNVAYLSNPGNSFSIWGSAPQNAAVYMDVANIYVPNVTFTINSNIMSVASGSGISYIAPTMLVNCAGVPAGTSLLATGADGTTGTGVSPVTGTYAMSQNATETITETCELDNATPYLISDLIVKNNVLVTTDVGDTTGSGAVNAIPFDWEYNTAPTTDTITGNKFWSAGSTSGRMAYVSYNADPTKTIAVCTYQFSTDGSCATNFNAMFPTNTYAGSNPFVNMGSGSAMSALYQTPGAYDFAPYNLR